MHTLSRNVLRDLICDTVRTHRSEAPQDLTDQILATLKVYAPKAFVEEFRDVLTQDDKYATMASDLIKSHAYDVSSWEINAAYPLLTEADVRMVDDLIGQAVVSVTFN